MEGWRNTRAVGAADGDAAAELGAGHPEVIAQHPQQGSLRIDVDFPIAAVDAQSDFHVALLGWIRDF